MEIVGDLDVGHVLLHVGHHLLESVAPVRIPQKIRHAGGVISYMIPHS